MDDIFICEVCQQELGLEEQSTDIENVCQNCQDEESQFKCCCCGNYFPSEEQGTCDDICQKCDEDY